MLINPAFERKGGKGPFHSGAKYMAFYTAPFHHLREHPQKKA
jgi:hypothetical protein